MSRALWEESKERAAWIESVLAKYGLEIREIGGAQPLPFRVHDCLMELGEEIQQLIDEALSEEITE